MKDMGRYYCPDEERALVHFTSRDLGESWQKAEPFVFSTRRVPFEEGGEREIARLERPFVYQEDGAPAMFFAAAEARRGSGRGVQRSPANCRERIGRARPGGAEIAALPSGETRIR